MTKKKSIRICSTRDTATNPDMRLSTRPSRHIEREKKRSRGRKTVTSTQRVEERRTSSRKDEKEKQRVQEGRKRGGNFRTSYTEFTATEEVPKKEIKQQGFKIKVVEKAGVAIKRLLQRSDPFKSRKCEREDCLVCREDGKGPCGRQCDL